jgi:Transposase DDE domain
MFASRLGSLNALEQVNQSPFLRTWLDGPLPSADSIGRICDLAAPDTVRLAIRALYAQLKRNKALGAPWHGLVALVLDGHESRSSYRTRCDGCLQREIRTASGTKTQYYHRDVWALLVADGLEIFLDCEPQKPVEDEVATALRLITRVLLNFPRAFDVVLADAIYTDPRFFSLLCEHDKDVLTVLKENQPGLLAEARTLSELIAPTVVSDKPKKIESWDMEGFTPWPDIEKSMRVVRTRETVTIKRQLDGKPEDLVSEWFWLMTLKKSQANARAAVELGHNRWIIENHGFNEAVNAWHADHVYKHEPTAMLVFSLLFMIMYNLFHTFYARNLKPACKAKTTMLHLARIILEELYRGLHRPLRQPP